MYLWVLVCLLSLLARLAGCSVRGLDFSVLVQFGYFGEFGGFFAGCCLGACWDWCCGWFGDFWVGFGYCAMVIVLLVA